MIYLFILNRFLKRISDEFSRKATSKGLILYSEHKGLNVTVKGDADKLEQVLANLLTNAIKFTSRGNVNFILNIQRENFGLKLEIPV